MSKKRTNGLPPQVYRGKSAYELRIYLGKNSPRKAIRLCDLTAPMSEIWAKYEQHTQDTVKSIAWLLRNHQNSPQIKKNQQEASKRMHSKLTE